MRPLIADRNGRTESSRSRDHAIVQGSGGMITVVGGKLTTYRVMAKQAVDRAARRLHEAHGVESGISPTADLPLPGAPREPWPAFLSRLRAEAAAR